MIIYEDDGNEYNQYLFHNTNLSETFYLKNDLINSLRYDVGAKKVQERKA